MTDRSPDRAERRSFAHISPDFETEETTEHRYSELIRKLEKRCDLRGGSELVSTLRSCGSSAPCGSAACPRCNRAFRLRLHRQARKILPRKAEILSISLIPRSSRVDVDELSDFDLLKWVKSRQRAISRALPDNAIFIGGIDISLNTWENSDPHWCFHIYGFIVLPEGWGVEKKRRRQLLRSDIAKHCPLLEPAEDGSKERPLLLKRRARSDFRLHFLYAYKSLFYRRSRYPYQKRNSTKISSNVRSQALPVSREIELALFLARYGVGSRLLLVGLRRQGHDANFSLLRRVTRQSSGLGGEKAQ